MSFGISVTDFLHVFECARSIYDAIKTGPREYREIASEVKTLRYTVRSLSEESRNPESILNQKGSLRRDELLHITKSCQETLAEVQKVIDENSSLTGDGRGKVIRTWHAYRVGSIDLEALRGRLSFHASMIGVFLSSLEASAIGRIERKIDAIYAQMVTEDARCDERHSIRSTASTASSILGQINTNEEDVWAALKVDLLAEGVSAVHIVSHREDIISYVKSLVGKETLVGTARKLSCDLTTATHIAHTEDRNRSDNFDRIVLGEADAVPMTAGSTEQFLPHRLKHLEDQGYEVFLIEHQFGRHNGRPACMLVLDMQMSSQANNPFLLPSADLSVISITPQDSRHFYECEDAGSSRHLGLPSFDEQTSVTRSFKSRYSNSSSGKDPYRIQGGGAGRQSPMVGTILEDRWEIAGCGRPSRFRFGVIVSHKASTSLVRVKISHQQAPSWIPIPTQESSSKYARVQEGYFISRPKHSDMELTGATLQNIVELCDELEPGVVPYTLNAHRNPFRRTL